MRNYISVAHAGSLIGIDRKVMYDLAHLDKIPAIRNPTKPFSIMPASQKGADALKWLIPTEEFLEWIEQSEIKMHELEIKKHQERIRELKNAATTLKGYLSYGT